MTNIRLLKFIIVLFVMTAVSSQVYAEKVAWVEDAVRTGQVVNFSSLLGYGSESTVLNDLLKSYSMVVIDFTATWCGPCRAMKPIFKDLAHEFPDILFLVVDVDQCKTICSRYGISSMPTFLFFKNGMRVNRITGSQSKARLQQVIRAL